MTNVRHSTVKDRIRRMGRASHGVRAFGTASFRHRYRAFASGEEVSPGLQ